MSGHVINLILWQLVEKVMYYSIVYSPGVLILDRTAVSKTHHFKYAHHRCIFLFLLLLLFFFLFSVRICNWLFMVAILFCSHIAIVSVTILNFCF